MKNPTIATLLNIIPGLGYFYLRSRRLFGSTILFGTIASFVASYLNPALAEYYTSELNMWGILGTGAILIIVGGFMYDAYRETHRINGTLVSGKR